MPNGSDFWFPQMLVGECITTGEVEETSAVDEELKALRKAIKTGRLEECKDYAPAAGVQCVIGQIVQSCIRIVLPSKLRSQSIAFIHEGGTLGNCQDKSKSEK